MIPGAHLWRDNPVLTKELRVRMRGSRAYWILAGYLLFLSFILFFQYTFWWNRVQSEGHGFSGSSKIGQEFFAWIMVTQAFLVAFITPAITSGAITIEKEQRTMEMLAMTRLPASTIVAGKLASAVGFVMLLLVSSLPLSSVCFFLGGVSPGMMALYYMLLIGGSFVAGALGLAWSSIARTTAQAVILTYGSLLLPVIAFFIFAVVASANSMNRNGPGYSEVLTISSGMALLGFPMPAQEFVLPEYFRYWNMSRYFGLSLPPWLPAFFTYSILGLSLAALAAVRLESFPERKAAVLRLFVAGFFLQQTFFYFGSRFSVYSGAAPKGMAATMAVYPLMDMLSYPVFLLLCCIPIFATGEVLPSEARGFTRFMLRGWSPAGLRMGKISSGLPYLLLLAGLVLGMFTLSLLFAGRTGASLPWVQLGHIAMSLVAAIVGLYAFCVLLSLVTRNRWIAALLGYAAIAAINIVPIVSRATYLGGARETGPSILMNLFYLNPLIAISEASLGAKSFWVDMPLMFGSLPVWQAMIGIYALLTCVIMLFAMPFVTRSAARPVLPYEGRPAA